MSNDATLLGAASRNLVVQTLSSNILFFHSSNSLAQTGTNLPELGEAAQKGSISHMAAHSLGLGFSTIIKQKTHFHAKLVLRRRRLRSEVAVLSGRKTLPLPTAALPIQNIIISESFLCVLALFQATSLFGAQGHVFVKSLPYLSAAHVFHTQKFIVCPRYPWTILRGAYYEARKRLRPSAVCVHT